MTVSAGTVTRVFFGDGSRSGWYPGFDGHAAGSDVPAVLRDHDAAADLLPPYVTIAVEANPARSLCAFADDVGQWHASR